MVTRLVRDNSGATAFTDARAASGFRRDTESLFAEHVEDFGERECVWLFPPEEHKGHFSKSGGNEGILPRRKSYTVRVIMETRRQCLAAIAGATAAMAVPPAPKTGSDRMTICAFSKHFQWTTLEETARICAGIGYEGIDITLRPGGHIEPERVDEELPKAVETIRKAGLTVPMVTAGIVDLSTPHTERVLKALAGQNIRHYRWGGFRYKDNVSLTDQIVELKPRVKDLAAMNKHYGLTAMYHTHSGPPNVGASFWDLYLILKDFDTNAVSVNYDIGHATVEGGFAGWIYSSRLLLPYTRGVAVKDFKWEQDAKGKWKPGWCALGKGMVNFSQFFGMLKANDFRGPLQLHMEYPDLGGADTGKKTFTIPKEQLLAIYKRDIDVLKKMLREAGLVS